MGEDITPDPGGGGGGFFSRLFDGISDFFGRFLDGGNGPSTPDVPSAPDPDPIGDSVKGLGDGPDVEDFVPRDLDSYSSFGEFVNETGAVSSTISISSAGIQASFYDSEGNEVGTQDYASIKEFFDETYDEMVDEGIEIEIKDEYARK